MGHDIVMEGAIVLWNRLDTSGTDACRFVPQDDLWTIEGRATFDHEGKVACLFYAVICASDWTTRKATVRGWVGRRSVSFDIQRDPIGDWILNGQAVPDAGDLLDIDLGFTPASNTNAIRRIALSIGEKTETTALWLDTEDWTLKRLVQTYHRTSDTTYEYSSPQHGYHAKLTTNDFGVVQSYPKLWVAVR